MGIKGHVQSWSRGVTCGGTGSQKCSHSDAWPQQTPVLLEPGCHWVAVAQPLRDGCTSMWMWEAMAWSIISWSWTLADVGPDPAKPPQPPRVGG